MRSIEEILERVHQDIATEDEVEYLHEQLSEEEINEQLQLFDDIEDVFTWEETQAARHFVDEHLGQAHKQVPFWKWSGFWMAILVAVGIFLASYFLFYHEEKTIPPEKAYATYYAPLDMEIEPVTRGDESVTTVTEIQELYMSEQYEKVLSQSASSEIDKILLYRALSFMEVSKFAEAETTFDKIESTSDKVLLKEISQWYSALVSLKQNDIEEAHNKLKEISSDKNHTYRDKADLLLESLDNN